MSSLKDPKIKLFGKTIELPDTSAGGEAIGPVSVRCSEPLRSSQQEPPCSSFSMLEDCNSDADKDRESSKNLSDADRTSKPGEGDGSEASDSRDKTALKRPDGKLPCPRCSSTETKFCYFNNYNSNQPRHFCKNCQRYWTAGGTTRNMPVGAGRRKNKNTTPSSSVLPQSHHFNFPEAPNHNGTLLSFVSNAPLCHFSVGSGNGSNDDTGRPGSVRNGCPFVPSWPYPWNPPPPPYWGWNVPWMVSCSGPNSPPTLGKHSREEDGCCLKSDISGGKEEEEEEEEEVGKEKSLWAPKALRIGDPKAAAKSSIWATLGVKSDRASDSISGGDGGFFRGFLQGDEKTRGACESSNNVLRANPAAFSRSSRFHESSF